MVCSTNFTWSILEYFVPFVTIKINFMDALVTALMKGGMEWKSRYLSSNQNFEPHDSRKPSPCSIKWLKTNKMSMSLAKIHEFCRTEACLSEKFEILANYVNLQNPHKSWIILKKPSKEQKRWIKVVSWVRVTISYC